MISLTTWTVICESRLIVWSVSRGRRLLLTMCILSVASVASASLVQAHPTLIDHEHTMQPRVAGRGPVSG